MVTFAVGNVIVRASEGHLIHPLPKDRIKQVLFVLFLKTSGQVGSIT